VLPERSDEVPSELTTSTESTPVAACGPTLTVATIKLPFNTEELSTLTLGLPAKPPMNTCAPDRKLAPVIVMRTCCPPCAMNAGATEVNDGADVVGAVGTVGVQNGLER
jgi:hypothetical protein